MKESIKERILLVGYQLTEASINGEEDLIKKLKIKLSGLIFLYKKELLKDEY